ncbi:ribonuclease Z [Serratia proteamaculans]|uniref:MBL fold metallo-hydrolase n=1 Tax=Serratia proteamaculans TaxID=28151 RepID=UPI0021773855|nr:MBL fold metallo-hydrolase [Serratia proteamaculans]CAI0730199.1 ribonuclease Z [Serratia proteamaculans]CAI1519438.1 ribonuclease Z [Serratia proteamaculans]CAI1524681.1 ribonuclease Z [Serratia proteamaculans]
MKLLSALAFAGLLLTHAATADTQVQAPGYYRMPLGKFVITAVSDGTVTIPLDKLLTHISPQELKQRMAQEAMTPQAETSINTFVIDTGKQRVLVDTGAGPLFGKAGGHLLENLRAAGYPAETLDAVLLTHIHGDHSGGVSLNGKPAFPNALVYVDKKDVDFWLNTANLSKVEASQRHTFKESADSLNPVIAADKLRTFTAPLRVLDGIQALPAPGHTPGSVVYRVESEGQTLVLWGDIIHAKAVQMPDPEVAIHFDVNQQQAVQTRERILAQVAREGDWVAAAHISFPGLGHVKVEGNGYRWVAANYTTQFSH